MHVHISYRQQVGEHLLSWVHDLESFAASDALQDLLQLKGESALLVHATEGWKALRNRLDRCDVSDFVVVPFILLSCFSRKNH